MQQLCPTTVALSRADSATVSCCGCVRCWSGCYLPSQALTLAGLASIHFFAAASGVILSAVMYLATTFWSSLVQLKFLISAAAGDPELASLGGMIFFSA